MAGWPSGTRAETVSDISVSNGIGKVPVSMRVGTAVNVEVAATIGAACVRPEHPKMGRASKSRLVTITSFIRPSLVGFRNFITEFDDSYIYRKKQIRRQCIVLFSKTFIM